MNQPLRQSQKEQSPETLRIQVQCINCRSSMWVRERPLAKDTIIRWDCPRCHFHNLTRQHTGS